MHVAVINKQLITLENANASQNKQMNRQTNKIGTKQKQAHTVYVLYRCDINSSSGRGSIRTHNKNGDAAVYGLCRLCAFSNIFIRMDYTLSHLYTFFNTTGNISLHLTFSLSLTHTLIYSLIPYISTIFRCCSQVHLYCSIFCSMLILFHTDWISVEGS